MLKRISILLCILSLNIGSFAQSAANAAPVKWQEYKISDQNLSILLPKMPIVFEKGDPCSHEGKFEYAAYAQETIYEMSVTFKNQKKAPDSCREVKNFDFKHYDDDIESIKRQRAGSEEKITKGGLEIVKIKGSRAFYVFIKDAKNSRWVRLSVWGANDESNPAAKRFFESLNLQSVGQGIEIGAGAEQTLGDEEEVRGMSGKNTDLLPSTEPEKMENIPMMIAIKPRPSYTITARNNQTVGVVRLKVTFQSNGAVGAVTPVKTLLDGLTEQAIFAAKRMVFIPARINGKLATQVRTVEYSFSIY